MVQIDLATWQGAEAAHEARIDGLTAGHRSRRGRGRAHPVEDFLFVYYNHSPARLRRWHPGPGVVLADAGRMPRAGWAHYATDAGGGVRLDVRAYLAARGSTVGFVRSLVGATLSRPAVLGCFGLHEWAMVHGLPEDEVRHGGWPLRLGAAGTDAVVEAQPVRCSHFDAYRFFPPSAAPLNALCPTRDRQVAMEQPGCLHAGMDVYKWCFKLGPGVPSELTADAFALALRIRELDMRASPYDLRELGYEPVRIETAEGRGEYASAQRQLATESNALRRRLLEALDRLDAWSAGVEPQVEAADAVGQRADRDDVRPGLGEAADGRLRHAAGDLDDDR